MWYNKNYASCCQRESCDALPFLLQDWKLIIAFIDFQAMYFEFRWCLFLLHWSYTSHKVVLSKHTGIIMSQGNNTHHIMNELLKIIDAASCAVKPRHCLSIKWYRAWGCSTVVLYQCHLITWSENISQNTWNLKTPGNTHRSCMLLRHYLLRHFVFCFWFLIFF